jgi:hypothetical protein
LNGDPTVDIREIAKRAFALKTEGSKTFETVLAMKGWPYGEKRVVVLSSRPVDISSSGGVVEQMTGAPAEIVS